MQNTDQKCVLVVDDDDMIRGTVSDILGLGGYRVETAANGQQAFAKMRTAHIDAILLDLMMPAMDGWTFVRRCRANPACSSRPVMLMSAHPQLPANACGLDVQGYLSKPFDLQVLLDTVARILENAEEWAH